MATSQRTFLVGVLVLTCAVGAFSAPGASAERAAAPGPWCGGTLWKLMTLSDAGRASVKWPAAATSIADVAKLPAPAKVPAARTTPFQKQQWKLTAVVDQLHTTKGALPTGAELRPLTGLTILSGCGT